MIATPPPAEPQYVTVSAILFSPEEGESLVATDARHRPNQAPHVQNAHGSFPSAVGHPTNPLRACVQSPWFNRTSRTASQKGLS